MGVAGNEIFGRVGPPFWDDAPVFLVGGGPSLCGFDFHRLFGYVVGVNVAMFDLPECCAGVSMDYNFVRDNHARLSAFAQRAELFLVIGDRFHETLPVVERAIYLREMQGPGLSVHPTCVVRGGSSGHTALGIAVLKLARSVVLLGYDYGRAGTGRHHYHDAYPAFHRADEQSWPTWAKHYDGAALSAKNNGIAVINASPQSRIEAFPKMTIEEGLAWAQCRWSFPACRGSATISINGR